VRLRHFLLEMTTILAIPPGTTNAPFRVAKEYEMKTLRFVAALALATLACTPGLVLAQDKGKTEAAELAGEAKAALQTLSGNVPLAKELAKTATAILVFPEVTKAGLGIGGQYGEGTLLKKGAAVAYYKTTGASFGLQAGGQKYGYAMFFMNAKALAELDKADGFEVGVGPSVVVVDEGKGKSVTTTTMKDDVYAFIFSQKGLMAGLGVQGNKITKITPK
jgi:lipid-binding SYLF domain-containing protein